MPPKRAAAAAAPSRAKQPRVQPADAPAPPPLGAAKPALPAPQAAKETRQQSPTNPAPKASSGNVEDSGDVSDDFDGVHELSAAEVAAAQAVRARCDQTDARLTLLLTTAEDKNYYRIRYLGASVPGSHDKKKAAMEAIRNALKNNDLFPTVSPWGWAPTTHAHLACCNLEPHGAPARQQVPRGEILDDWLDTATCKRKEETKGDHTGAGDDPAAGIPSVGALSLTLSLSLSLSLSLTLTTLTLIVCVGQRGPRADPCQYCVIGWNNNLSKVLHGPAPSAARHARGPACAQAQPGPPAPPARPAPC